MTEPTEATAGDAADAEAATPPVGEGGGRAGPATDVTSAEVEAGAAEAERRGGSAAWLVGSGIFLSRIGGFVREAVFAFFFGASAVADVWRAALRTPNVIQNLLGEGTLSASFIPVYAEFVEQGRREDAARFAGAVLGLLSVTAFGLALIGVLLAPLLVPVFYPRFTPEQQALAVVLIRILFLMTAVLAVSAWALGILNSHRKFFVSYTAPVVWNVAMIATMLYFGLSRGWEGSTLAVALAWGAFAGGILQLAVQLPWVFSHLDRFRPSLSRSVVGVQEALRNFIPVVTARGVINLSGWLDMVLAALLATGAVATIGYAQTLYMLPISLFGMAIAASELPELSRNRHDVQRVLGPRVRSALRRVAFLVLPSAFAFLVLGDLFVAALFQRGAFDRPDTVLTYAILATYSLSLLASASSRALSSAYYAIRDTRTPAKIAYWRVGVSAVVGASLMFPLDMLSVGAGAEERHFGAVGLALGAGVGAWLEYALLRRRLRDAMGPHAPEQGAVARMVASAAVAAVAAFAAKWWLGSLVPLREGLLGRLLEDGSWVERWLRYPLLAAGTGLVFGVVYLASTSALGVGAPLRSLLRRARS